MAARFIHLPRNKDGRDFVIGDIHGEYDMVDLALEKVRFNPEQDRLISVGDLIDRGPQSERCLEFLSRSYVHAIRGNHEDMLLEYYELANGDDTKAMELLAKDAPRSTETNGMGWLLESDSKTRLAIVEACRNLPIAMETSSWRGSVGFVHADVPAHMNWEQFTAAIRAGDYKTIGIALWGRERIYDGNDQGVEGIARLFVGHSIVDRADRLGNVYYVDTGSAYKGAGGLTTIADILSRSESFGGSSSPVPKGEPVIDVFIQQPERPDQPFGDYVRRLSPFGEPE